MEFGGERREIQVSGSVTVGREKTATLHVDDKTLSREHTKFYIENGKLFVRDLESRNGTFLNGQRIQNTQPLKPGDRVKVGLATFTVLAEGGAMPAVSAQLASAPAAPAPRPPSPPTRRTTVAATTRPKLGGPHPVAVFFYRIILLAVIVVVAYLSKGIFKSILHGIHS